MDSDHPRLATLSRAAGRWVQGGDGRDLVRWLGRELDQEGVPARLGVPDWPRCLRILAAARRVAGDWPPGCEERIAGLLLASLRFARPDGSAALRSGTAGASPGGITADWAEWYRGTGLARVLQWWFGPGSGRARTAPPPLPTWSATDRVLAVLRPDWSIAGDFLAIDHRDTGSPGRIEVFGGGRTWLGPEWGDGPGLASRPVARPRPSRRIHGAAADLVEWTYRADGVRATRSALLLRTRRLALISTVFERTAADWGEAPALGLAVPTTVTARPVTSARALALAGPERRGGAQAIPIALPCRPYASERGSLLAREGTLTLTQAPAGRRCWLPLLLSWDAERHRKTLEWRILTVTERSRPVAPDRALAARVSWGRDETFVIYRSLGPPAPRAFLGHKTAARFLVADFTEDGDLKPILTIE